MCFMYFIYFMFNYKAKSICWPFVWLLVVVLDIFLWWCLNHGSQVETTQKFHQLTSS